MTGHKTDAEQAHQPCEDVTKARSDIFSMKWVLGVLMGIALTIGAVACNSIIRSTERMSKLESRADVTEDRYERTQDDIRDIKMSIGDIKRILEDRKP